LGEAWKLRQPPRVADYAASDRRIVFNEDGIFRRYKALNPLSSFRDAPSVGNCRPEATDPESRDSAFASSTRPGMTANYLFRPSKRGRHFSALQGAGCLGHIFVIPGCAFGRQLPT
jgi:hypothetical protein